MSRHRSLDLDSNVDGSPAFNKKRHMMAHERRVILATTALLGIVTTLPATALLTATAAAAHAQTQTSVPSDAQKSIVQKLRSLRKLSDDERAQVTRQLALDIRQLPDAGSRLQLANSLASLATEGDFGFNTLQEVATTLADALTASPLPPDKDGPASPYVTLAQLVRYENVKASVASSQFSEALTKLQNDDQNREKADFTLKDLQGNPWTLKSLHGKVVLVNFWATWCPPCRKEMPDMELLYNRFKDRGFVILGISDEEANKVQPYIAQHPVTYPILLDPGRKVNTLFAIEGIPRSLVYDRKGHLVAEAIDMRTQKQLLALVRRAGLR